MLKEIGIFQFFILWERIILVFVLAVLYRHIAGRKKFSYLPFLQFLVIFLPIRDVVLTFFPIVEIFMISDIVVFSILFFFLKEQAGNRPYDPAAIVLAIAYGIILLVQSRFPVYPEGIARFQRIPLVLYGLFIGGASFLRGKKDPLAFSCRYPLLLGLLAYNAFLIFLGDEDPISQAIAVPAPYLIPLFILFRQNAMLEKEKDLQIESLSAQIDSLFEFMRNIGSAITEKIELSRVLTYITATAVRNTEAEAGAVLLIKEGHNLTVQAVSGFFPPPYPVTAEESASERSLMETFKSRELPIGSTILGETVQSGTPVIIKDSRWDVRLKNNSGPGLTHISSLIAIPLIVSKKILGVLAVVKTRENSEFTDGNLFSLRSFADYTSLTLDNLLTYIELLEKKEMEREVFIAADIQQKLLPSKIKPVKGVSISAFSIPAKGVSGDYYDVIPFKGKTAMVICDVAGKGVPASLVMIMIRSIIHLVASPAKDTATIVNWINKGITGRIEIDHFATLSYLLFDGDTRILEYTNAGHLPMLIRSAKGNTISTVDTPGLPLGIEGSSRYEKKHIRLDRGDMAVLYTDGIVEAMNPKGEQYSVKRLEAFILAHADDSAEDFTEKLKKELSDFVGKARQHDDQTLLVIKGE